MEHAIFEGYHERLPLRLNNLDYLSTDDRLNGNDNMDAHCKGIRCIGPRSPLYKVLDPIVDSSGIISGVTFGPGFGSVVITTF